MNINRCFHRLELNCDSLWNSFVQDTCAYCLVMIGRPMGETAPPARSTFTNRVFRGSGATRARAVSGGLDQTPVPSPSCPLSTCCSHKCRVLKAPSRGKGAPPFPHCNRRSYRRFPAPHPSGARSFPAMPLPRRAHERTAIRKWTNLFFSSECPRFRQRARWQRREEPVKGLRIRFDERAPNARP